MSLLSIFLVSFIIAISGALTPGPLLATVIYETSRRGAKAGPLIVAGHGLLEVVMVGVIVFGLASFIHHQLVMMLIGLSGALILFLLGIHMLLNIPKMSLQVVESGQPARNLVLTGVVMSLANPYWTIWWLTIGLGLVISAQRGGWPAISIFFLGHILGDLVWFTFVSVGLSRGRRLLSDLTYRGLLYLCAASLLAFGIYFGLSAFKV
jgi:threonine/homoserine/homoserine lactone efflux protein